MTNEWPKLSSFPTEEFQLLQYFAKELIFNSYSMTTILKGNGEITQKQFSFVLFENLNFLIFLVDKMSAEIADIQKRSQLMRELTDSSFYLLILTLSPGLEDKAKDSLYNQCRNNLISFIEEYRQYKFIQDDKSSGSEDTVLWEFSKKIQEFTKDPYNIGAILGYQNIIIQVMKNIDIETFLEKFK